MLTSSHHWWFSDAAQHPVCLQQLLVRGSSRYRLDQDPGAPSHLLEGLHLRIPDRWQLQQRPPETRCSSTTKKQHPKTEPGSARPPPPTFLHTLPWCHPTRAFPHAAQRYCTPLSLFATCQQRVLGLLEAHPCAVTMRPTPAHSVPKAGRPPLHSEDGDSGFRDQGRL